MNSIVYFAGFFDGEGSVSVIPHTKYSKSIIVSAQVSQVDPRPLIVLKEMFGGSLCHVKSRKNHQDIWKWSVFHKKAEVFLKAIQPYCIVKREQIDVALKIRGLIKIKAGSEENRVLPKETYDARVALMTEWKQLKEVA